MWIDHYKWFVSCIVLVPLHYGYDQYNLFPSGGRYRMPTVRTQCALKYVNKYNSPLLSLQFLWGWFWAGHGWGRTDATVHRTLGQEEHTRWQHQSGWRHLRLLRRDRAGRQDVTGWEGRRGGGKGIRCWGGIGFERVLRRHWEWDRGMGGFWERGVG